MRKPTMVEAYCTFSPIIGFFSRLVTGEVDVNQKGEIVYKDPNGTYKDAVSNINTLIHVFEVLRLCYNIPDLGLNKVKKVMSKLEYGIPITPIDAEECYQSILDCRRVYRNMDVDFVRHVTHEEVKRLKGEMK